MWCKLKQNVPAVKNPTTESSTLFIENTLGSITSSHNCLMRICTTIQECYKQLFQHTAVNLSVFKERCSIIKLTESKRTYFHACSCKQVNTQHFLTCKQILLWIVLRKCAKKCVQWHLTNFIANSYRCIKKSALIPHSKGTWGTRNDLSCNTLVGDDFSLLMIKSSH